MKTKSFLLLFLLFFVFAFKPVISNAQIWQWTKGISGTSWLENMKLNNFVVDQIGNIYCTGYFYGTYDFDSDSGTQMITSFGQSGFVAKYGPSGQLLWVNQLESDTSAGIDIKLDDLGNLYVCGYFFNTLTIQSNTLVGSSYFNGFVLKMNPQGAFQWAKALKAISLSLNDDVVPNSICFDDNRNIYLAGYFNCEADFDPGNTNYIFQVGSLYAWESFYLKLDSIGNFIWAKRFAGNFSFASGIIKDYSGKLIIHGFLGGSVDFDSDSLTNATSDTGYYICKIDTSGALLFAKVLSTSSIDYYYYHSSNCLEIDQYNNIYTAGNLYDTTDFDPGSMQYNLIPSGGVNVFLCLLDSGGNFLWAKTIASGTGIETGGITIDSNQNVYITGMFTDSADFDPGPGVYNLFSHGVNDSYLCILDAAGNLNYAINFGYSTGINSGSCIKLDGRNNIILAGNYFNVVDFDPGPSTFFLDSNFSKNVYFSKFIRKSNLVTGNIFKDINGNGLKDAGDLPFSGIIAGVMPGPLYFNSQNSGVYIAYVDSGNFSLQLFSPPLYYSVNPSSQTANFSGYNQVDSLNDFGLFPYPNINDLRITLTQINDPRPGWFHFIKLSFSNIGTTILNGSVVLIDNPDLNYINSTPTHYAISNDSVFWNFINLQPLETRSIIIIDSVSSSLTSFSSIVSNAVIYPLVSDTTPLNNFVSLIEVIANSHDPNYKEATPENIITSSQITDGDYISYTIHFQNTGNAIAQTVSILDTLHTNLLIPTFEILGSSNPLSWNMSGAGNIEFLFNDIMLPDSNLNEPMSHGFVKYRIKPKPTLAIGDMVKNTAYIYFDFNEPVKTNEVIHLIGANTVETPGEFAESGISLFPNPAKGSFFITLNSGSDFIHQVSIYDLYGRELYAEFFSTENKEFTRQVNIKNLRNGLYFIKVNNGTSGFCKKIIVSH